MNTVEFKHGGREAGFSYIEVMVAIVILMVGILGVLAAISASVIQSRGQRQQLTARHILGTTMESIMAAKETDPLRLGWKSIGNVGSNLNELGVPQGVFLTGFRPVQTIAGTDEVVGTGDDSGAITSGYEREIVITDLCDTDRPSANCALPGTWPVKLRSVRVTVRYWVGTTERQERLATVLTDYSKSN
ncbi:MAG: hypothetical protein ABL984_01810 [Pyrinomonadaceae bacterium]